MQGAWELSHGGRISFALGGLGGASEITGEILQWKSFQLKIGRTFSTPLKKEWAAQKVMSSWSMEVCKHSLMGPLGRGFF